MVCLGVYFILSIHVIHELVECTQAEWLAEQFGTVITVATEQHTEKA